MAAKQSEDVAKPLISWISLRIKAVDQEEPLSFSQWRSVVADDLQHETELTQHLARLSLAISFLRATAQKDISLSPAEISLVWDWIRRLLTDPSLQPPLFVATRSAQGFLAVPLCNILNKDGTIDELFRFHIWLPNREPGNSDMAIHSHQPFAQSWILAGQGTDLTYNVTPTTDASSATHAEYALSWDDGKTLDKTYKTHQKFSVVSNTHRFVRASLAKSAVHKRDMTYTIPAGEFHVSDVSPDVLHATIFFFDSRRGFEKDAPVLGPKDAESFRHRKPDGTAPSQVAEIVDAVRSWEVSMEQGKHNALNADWEHAFQEFTKALNLAESLPMAELSNASHYRMLVLGELGSTNRRFGRYDKARDFLEAALADTSPSPESVEISGELGVVYRHMDRLQDAKRAFQTQYDTAKQVRSEPGVCRAVGNLAMVNYQLSQQHHPQDDSLLAEAIEQQRERVERARKLRRDVQNSDLDPSTRSHRERQATAWESIGLDRLSLCYTASGDTKKAINCCLESQQINSTTTDVTIKALSRFFYGRALYRDGQRDAAMLQFNQAKPCSPVIALCKEPSAEHRQYLRELVDAGVDMDLVDDNGYTALDYAVFNDDKKTEALLLEWLSKGLGGNSQDGIQNRQSEARLRKAYRELFQERLRTVLLKSRPGDNLQALRREYAVSLAEDEGKRKMLDSFKFLRYTDFCTVGNIPNWNSSSLQTFNNARSDVDFVIFFSYRWINKAIPATSPDDEAHTQYRRMIEATEEFLTRHPEVSRERLGLWVDYACVCQDDPLPGVHALPLILMQCNAVISLFDDDYYDRAWCSVEVLMIQAIKKSYNLHLWYEYRPRAVDMDAGEASFLHPGPVDLEISMAKKLLTREEDRAKVLFLERQGKLLG